MAGFAPSEALRADEMKALLDEHDQKTSAKLDVEVQIG